MIDWMLNEFPTWFTTGLYHILDLDGYDHMLFLWCLCIRYTLNSWRSVLILVTAFTIGHSITLIASVSGFLTIQTAWVELSIAITILISAIIPFIKNINQGKNFNLEFIAAIEKTSISYYHLALVFGFIHGMGFSNLLIQLLGNENAISGPLLGFNVGIEFGQLVFVIAILSVATVLKSIKPILYTKFITSSLIIGILLSLQMIVARIQSLIL